MLYLFLLWTESQMEHLAQDLAKRVGVAAKAGTYGLGDTLFDKTACVIPFTTRESFKTAWPQILKLKGTGAPAILLAGPQTEFGKFFNAGVRVWCP